VDWGGGEGGGGSRKWIEGEGGGGKEVVRQHGGR